MSASRETEEDLVEAPVETPDVETRAKQMGWVPKNQFRGDPARWVEAEEFVRRGDEELPIARQNLRRTAQQLDRTVKELGEVRSLMEEMRHASAKNEQRAYERAKAELLAERDHAVRGADTAAFEAADRKLQALETEKPKAAPGPVRPAVAEPAPEAVEWVNRQPWWNKNRAATAMALQLHDALTKGNPGMSLSENLAEVERRIRGAYPEEFPAARREQPAVVSSSSVGTAPRKGKLSFDALPVDERGPARAAYAKFKKQMPNYTEEEYLSNYDWG